MCNRRSALHIQNPPLKPPKPTTRNTSTKGKIHKRANLITCYFHTNTTSAKSPQLEDKNVKLSPHHNSTDDSNQDSQPPDPAIDVSEPEPTRSELLEKEIPEFNKDLEIDCSDKKK